MSRDYEIIRFVPKVYVEYTSLEGDRRTKTVICLMALWEQTCEQLPYKRW